MPAAVWRTRPARSIRRCEAICASAGFSFIVGSSEWDRRISVLDCGARDPTGTRALPPGAVGCWDCTRCCAAQTNYAMLAANTAEKGVTGFPRRYNKKWPTALKAQRAKFREETPVTRQNREKSLFC